MGEEDFTLLKLVIMGILVSVQYTLGYLIKKWGNFLTLLTFIGIIVLFITHTFEFFSKNFPILFLGPVVIEIVWESGEKSRRKLEKASKTKLNGRKL